MRNIRKKQLLLCISLLFILLNYTVFTNYELLKKRNRIYLRNESNPHDFKYLLNPGYNICGDNGGKDVTLLAMVPVHANGFNQRFIIRNTWGSKTVYPKQLKLIFLIGNSGNGTINSKIR